jgi:hypothetical protein
VPPCERTRHKIRKKEGSGRCGTLTQKNHEEAARAIGVDLKTLKRWMRLPEFIEEWRRARWEVVEQAYARAQQNCGAGTSVLLKLMADPSVHRPDRVGSHSSIPEMLPTKEAGLSDHCNTARTA